MIDKIVFKIDIDDMGARFRDVIHHVAPYDKLSDFVDSVWNTPPRGAPETRFSELVSGEWFMSIIQPNQLFRKVDDKSFEYLASADGAYQVMEFEDIHKTRHIVVKRVSIPSPEEIKFHFN